MAKGRRTKEQKRSARHGSFQYNLPSFPKAARSVSAKSPRAVGARPAGLFAYDPRLIRVDLTKTLILSILAIATIVAVYYFKLI